MELKRTFKYNNIEEETFIYNALKYIKINYEIVGKGDFSSYHTLFNCMISDTKGNHHQFTYQCNLKYTRPNETSLLACLISDALCYEDSNVGDDIESMQNFSDNFGYDGKLKELIKAYNACKATSIALHKMFSDDEITTLYDALNENGEM